MMKPLNYKNLNRLAGLTRPSTVKGYNNQSYIFWERAFFQRAVSVMKFTLPEFWQGDVNDFFNFALFGCGFVAIFDSPEYGMSFQPCTLSGRDFYYQPTRALISNPAMPKDYELMIGSECEILKLTPDYMGILDIVSYYAAKAALLDAAIDISLVNSKFGLMIGAKSKTAAEALKKMYDKINQGEPAVFYDKTLMEDRKDTGSLWEVPDLPNVKDNYLLHDQLQDFQTIINNFDAEIGIPTLPYQKKERLNTIEASSRVIDSTSRSLTWYNTLKSSIAQVKRLYPELTLDVELRYPPEGGVENVNIQNDTAGAL